MFQRSLFCMAWVAKYPTATFNVMHSRCTNCILSTVIGIQDCSVRCVGCKVMLLVLMFQSHAKPQVHYILSLHSCIFVHNMWEVMMF